VSDLMRLDQELARKAAELLGDTVKPDLRTRMRSLPVMIQTSGLAATVAFLLSRAKGDDRENPYWRTAELILSDAAATAGIQIAAGTPKSSLKTVADASPAQYVLAETRAIQLAIWLSRLADALVERPDSPDSPKGS
jgi:CRISPR type III-B/RAMP module-associated protein Cmr5